MPVPETDTAVVVGVEEVDCPGAELAVSEAAPFIETLPAACPADFGANTRLNVVLCPGPSVTGRLSPVKLNAALLTEAWLTVTLESPLFVIVADFAML
jgi:hypothetical protein